MLFDPDPLAVAIAGALTARGARVAVAETTAGGLVAARLLSVAGASNWFDRGVVCYGGRSKQELTGVDPELLRTHGAVSVEAVGAMAEGLRGLAGVDYAAAESGIAGPLGSRRSPKPVGAVCIAVTGPPGTVARELLLPGTRVEVMAAIAEATLQMLLDHITVSA